MGSGRSWSAESEGLKALIMAVRKRDREGGRTPWDGTGLVERRQPGNPKLNPQTVRLMRAAYRDGFTMERIAEMAGCPYSTARKAIIGVTWKHVKNPGPIEPREARRRTAEDIAKREAQVPDERRHALRTALWKAKNRRKRRVRRGPLQNRDKRDPEAPFREKSEDGGGGGL